MNKSFVKILSILLILLKVNGLEDLIEKNIAIAKGGSASLNVNNNAETGPIDIHVNNNHHNYHKRIDSIESQKVNSIIVNGEEEIEKNKAAVAIANGGSVNVNVENNAQIGQISIDLNNRIAIINMNETFLAQDPNLIQVYNETTTTTPTTKL